MDYDCEIAKRFIAKVAVPIGIHFPFMLIISEAILNISHVVETIRQKVNRPLLV